MQWRGANSVVYSSPYLPARQLHALGSNKRVVAVDKLSDEVMGICLSRRLEPNFYNGCNLMSVASLPDQTWAVQRWD